MRPVQPATVRPLLALLLLAFCACGEPDPGLVYPRDAVVRLNQLQAKGTHNSYHLDSGNGVAEWSYGHAPLSEQLASEGVRHLELDLYYEGPTSDVRFEVKHLPWDPGTTCAELTECLDAIASWSTRHRGHSPIMVLLEPKDSYSEAQADDYFRDLESEILSIFPRDRLITPALVQGSSATLRDAIVSRGWPTLGEVRGRVMFVLLDGDEYRRFYTHGGQRLDDRLLFAISGTSEPYASFVLVDDAIAQQAAIRDAVGRGFLARTHADIDTVEGRSGDRTRLEAALASGAQFISTDFAVPAQSGYVLDIPGGTPSRCNPVTADAACAAFDIEH